MRDVQVAHHRAYVRCVTCPRALAVVDGVITARPGREVVMAMGAA